MNKRAISKNYFYWEPPIGSMVFDQRNVNTFLKKGKKPVESALDFNDIETKILIYEDRVKEWFLEIGKKLKQDNEAGFVILQIALSYIEGNQQFREGKTSQGKSKLFFRKAMKRIFNELFRNRNTDAILDKFYEQARCGLFHDGMTRRFVTISGEFENALIINDSNIMINPHKFLDKVYNDFEDYVTQLKNKDNKELIERFEKQWNSTG